MSYILQVKLHFIEKIIDKNAFLTEEMHYLQYVYKGTCFWQNSLIVMKIKR